VPAAQWTKINSGTTDIATACGFILERRAFPHQHPQVAKLESLALTGAGDLAAVLRHDQTDLFQGETVRATAKSSLGLLHQCGLRRAGARLQAALTH
jgi:hypothetical protein